MSGGEESTYVDEYDDPQDLCDHEDYDVDILSGRASCNNCLAHWYVDQEEVERQIEHQRRYSDWEERENRWEFWRKLTHPVRWPIYRLLERIWPRKSCSVLTDDEIPF